MNEVFENEHFVVVEKPAGWLSVPARMSDDGRPCVGTTLQSAKGFRIWPVHRLDFEVAGLLLFAKNAEAHRAANAAFENRRVRKIYEALTEHPQGIAIEIGRHFEWRSKLLRGKKRAYEHELGKEAVTIATPSEKLSSLSRWRWRLEPLTGRSHQLRVHLAKHGFPIVGDGLYGAIQSFGEHAIALKAIELDFSQETALLNLGLPAHLKIAGF